MKSHGKRRFVAGMIAATVASATLAACGSGSDSGGARDDSGPYRVLVLTALSGPIAPGGLSQVQGVKAAAARLNEGGGINGREIVVSAADTAATAQNAVSQFQKAQNGDTPPDLVFAGITSDETLALCPIIARAGLLSVSQTADDKVGDPKICPNHFSTALNASGVTKLMADYMKGRGWRKIALLTDSGAYGTSVLDAAKAAIPEAGLTVVASQQFASDAVDTTQQWKSLKSSGADVVVIEGQGPVIGAALNGRITAGWDVAVLVAPGAVGSDPAKLVRSPEVLGNTTFFASQAAIEGRGTSNMKEAVTYFGKVMDNKPYTGGRNIQALAWDALAIIETAARVAGTTDPIKLKAALEGFGDNPPDRPSWISREAFGFTKESHFSGPEGYAEPAKPAPLSEGGTLPPAS